MKRYCWFYLVLVFLPLWVSAQTGLVSVQGRATLDVKPDLVRVHFSVSNIEQPTLALAKAEVERKASKLGHALIKFGIGEDDIHSPSYVINGEPKRYGNCDRKWVPEVSRKFVVALRKPKRYSKLLDLLIELGVTRVDYVELDVEKRKQFEDKAMRLAMKDAIQQAQFYAEGFGVPLGKVHSIGQRQNTFNGRFEEDLMALRGAAPKDESVGGGAVEPYDFKLRDIEISASIAAEFSLQ